MCGDREQIDIADAVQQLRLVLLCGHADVDLPVIEGVVQTRDSRVAVIELAGPVEAVQVYRAFDLRSLVVA